MARLAVVQEKSQQGRLGPVARLLPTTAVTTIRGREPLVIDGPFAETRAARLLHRRLFDTEGRL
jgi:hypothetical protein